MDIRKFRYFVAVAEELNFSRAARRLSITQPPLSAQIKILETELGVQLFTRSSRGVKLTTAGEVFLAKCYPILEQVEAATYSTQRAAHGGAMRVRIGVVGSALLTAVPNVVTQAQKLFPDAEISLLEMGSTDQLSALFRDQIDIGLVHAPVTMPGLASMLVAQEPYVLALPSNHPKVKNNLMATLSDFAHEPFVCFSREVSPFLFDNLIVACRRAGFSPKIGHSARHVFTMLQMVRIGKGVALVPASAIDSGATGVAFHNLVDPVGPVKICAVCIEKNLTALAIITPLSCQG